MAQLSRNELSAASLAELESKPPKHPAQFCSTSAMRVSPQMSFSLPVLSRFPSQTVEGLGLLEAPAQRHHLHQAFPGPPSSTGVPSPPSSLSSESLSQLSPIILALHYGHCHGCLVPREVKLDLVHLCITQHPVRDPCSMNV